MIYHISLSLIIAVILFILPLKIFRKQDLILFTKKIEGNLLLLERIYYQAAATFI